MPSKKLVADPPRVEDVEPQPLDLIQPLDPKVSEYRCGPRERCSVLSNLMAEMMIPAIILAMPSTVYFARELITPDEFNFRFPAAVYAAILRVTPRDITRYRDLSFVAVKREVERVEEYDYSDQFPVLYQLLNFGRLSHRFLKWYAAEVRNRARLRRLEREAWEETYYGEALEGCDAADAARKLAQRASALAKEFSEPRPSQARDELEQMLMKAYKQGRFNGRSDA